MAEAAPQQPQQKQKHDTLVQEQRPHHPEDQTKQPNLYQRPGREDREEGTGVKRDLQDSVTHTLFAVDVDTTDTFTDSASCEEGGQKPAGSSVPARSEGQAMHRCTGRSVVCFLATSLAMGAAISTIVIGVLYLSSCPARPDLPVYLLVLGIIIILRLTCVCKLRIPNGLQCHLASGAGENHVSTSHDWILTPWSRALEATLLVILILESIHVVRLCGENIPGDPAATGYCHPVLYTFAIALTAAVWWVLLSTTMGVFLWAAARCCCCCFQPAGTTRDVEWV